MSSAGDETLTERELQLEEKALVQRMLAGDARSMEEFADGYFPPLFRFALSRLGGDSELSREIVQTTVCKALSKLASYRGDAPLFTWLCACCRNEIGMHFRRKKRFPAWVPLDEGPPAQAALPMGGREPSAESSLVRRELGQRVHGALDLLPPRYARALEMKYVEEHSVQDIAAELGLGPKAAESLLTRARNAFRKHYAGLRRDQREEIRMIAAGGRGVRR